MTAPQSAVAAGVGGPLAAIDTALARAVVDEAMARYFAARRARVPAFVDRHFTVTGSLLLHRHALGWDVLRAPCNLVLSVPTVGIKLAAAGSRQLGAARLSRWLDSRNLFLATAVGREIEWLFHTELLELPYAQDDRVFGRDALAEQILADPRIAAGLETIRRAVADLAGAPDLQARLTEALANYTGTRTAAADLASALISSSIGALAFQQVTPSALSLGPILAATLAQQTAIAGFPLGAGLGGLWYGMFPAAASPALVAGTTGGLMALTAVFAAFAGVVTDPVQRRLGLHQRRLLRLLAVLERQFRGDGDVRFVVRDHYVTRLLDLADVLRLVARLGH